MTTKCDNLLVSYIYMAVEVLITVLTCVLMICLIYKPMQGPHLGLWISSMNPQSWRCLIIYVTLSHLRSKESTGIHKPCISGLFPIPIRVHLKVEQRVQRNNFPRIHLNVLHIFCYITAKLPPVTGVPCSVAVVDNWFMFSIEN